MATKKPIAKSLPVRGRSPGRLETLDDDHWKQLDKIAQTIRSLGDSPLTQTRAQHLAKRLGVNWRTVYRYRQRLQEVDEATALLGRTRGWKPLHSRLTNKQESAIEQSIAALRKKPGPLRVVDLVEEVEARCRKQHIKAPSRYTIDKRLKRTAGVKVHRRGAAPPGNGT